MSIDCRRACLQPHPRRAPRHRDCATHSTNRVHSGINNFLSIGWRVSAVDGATGGVDDDIGTVEFVRPLADVRETPPLHAPRRGLGWPAAEDQDLVTVFVEGTR